MTRRKIKRAPKRRASKSKSPKKKKVVRAGAKKRARPAAKKSKSARKSRGAAKKGPAKRTLKRPAAAAQPSLPPIRAYKRELDKSFEPKVFENEHYQFWMQNGCFDASDTNAPGQESFCIVIPPPNVTGVLHMGHALSYSIQDILTRWRRMKGDNVLWLPGTDHAGIATQAQVEKSIRPKTRHDLGREEFVKRVWWWKEEYGGNITRQMKSMGFSVDWKRERFTMDEGLSDAVKEVFCRLYEQELIYRGERIINWCPRCQTALSDLEVVPTDRKGFLWHIKYPIVDDDGSNLGELIIATTRPETLLGDTAVAVHPEDERYKKFHGKKAVLPLLGRKIPVIVDSYVDREFGTGGLKVTPAHDFNDYDLGKKHGLPMVSVMGKDGKLTPAAGPYAGLKFAEARERIVQELKQSGQLIKTEDHALKLGLCQRCDNVAEPIVSKQWFVKIEPLAKPAIKAVETGEIEFTPKNWEKTYFEWMYNIRDWCISRQLWWGHQIPAWYCADCQEITVARAAPAKCSHCGGKSLKQDEDVLDTWFSSGLWPFSTLGWPAKTQALKTFYPTTIMETGTDIIFFWVARMIMMGIHFMGEVPFKKVYLHALVRDEKGEKMSKSRGNVIDPLVVTEKHGADPLRFTLAAMAGQGRDIKLSVDRVEGYRAFCNKLWNAVKFFHLQLTPENGGPISEPAGGAEAWLKRHRVELATPNRWILSLVSRLAKTVDDALASFQLDVAAQALYAFTWHELCDWYIEFAKIPLREGEEEANGGARSEGREETLVTLHYTLERLLRLMHPIMPYVTEELWQSLPWKKPANTPARRRDGKAPIETVMLQDFPRIEPAFLDVEAEQTMGALKGIVDAIRNFRGEHNISPKVGFSVRYVPGSPAVAAYLRAHEAEIRALTRVDALVHVQSHGGERDGEAVIRIEKPLIEFRIDLKGLVDTEGESKRLRKEIERAQVDLDHVRSKLGRESFVAKAPPELVAKERGREKELLHKLGELEGALKRLGGGI